MSLISQILSASYPEVLDEMRKPANQFAESAALREFETQGFIKKISMGTTIDHTLDYQRNPGAKFLTNDLDPVSMAKVEVLTAASYTPGEIGVPIVWSKGDETMNATENQKVDLVKSLIENAITSHDDLLEENLFGTSNGNFIGLDTLFPTSGQGSPGGIASATEAWWRHYAATYLTNGTDMNAQLATAFNTASKGSGGMQPTLLLSGATPQALYEAGLTTNKRYIDTKEGDAGFKVLAFRTARWVESQYGSGSIYGLNPKIVFLNVAKNAFRDLDDVLSTPSQFAFVRKVYTMLQLTTNNKSRGFRLDHA